MKNKSCADLKNGMSILTSAFHTSMKPTVVASVLQCAPGVVLVRLAAWQKKCYAVENGANNHPDETLADLPVPVTDQLLDVDFLATLTPFLAKVHVL